MNWLLSSACVFEFAEPFPKSSVGVDSRIVTVDMQRLTLDKDIGDFIKNDPLPLTVT